MAKAEKVAKVKDLKERIKGSQALLLADYRGLTVADATELRRALGESDARFAIVKNTLMQRAAHDAGIEALEALLVGPTAVAFVAGDPVGAAKKVVEATRRFPTFALKGAYLEGKVLSAEEAQALATLESREAMLSKVAGLLKTEMSRAAAMFAALQGRFLSLLEAYKEKLPAAEEAVTPTAETEETIKPEAEAAGDEEGKE